MREVCSSLRFWLGPARFEGHLANTRKLFHRHKMVLAYYIAREPPSVDPIGKALRENRNAHTCVEPCGHPPLFPHWWAADPGMEGLSRALNDRLPGQEWSLPRRFTPSFMTARINNDLKHLFPVSPRLIRRLGSDQSTKETWRAPVHIVGRHNRNPHPITHLQQLDRSQNGRRPRGRPRHQAADRLQRPHSRL